MIPMVDLQTQYANLKPEIDTALAKALEKCQFILGPNVNAFEKEAAEYLGSKYAITCASGTDALHLALLAADIRPGDEVITTPFTFIATAEAIKYVGASPVFVDINPKTYNIDPEQIAAAITKKTKAILPVHLFGQAAAMQEIKSLAQDHNILLIEDCAQSFGALFQKQQTGTIGELGCFSFFPSKNLGCYGDGGMVITDSDHYADRVKLFRNHGSEKRYHHSAVGLNSRLDELQAVILRIKLQYIDDYNKKRAEAAKLYDSKFANTELVLPYSHPSNQHVFHQYTLLLPEYIDRELVIKCLQDHNIASGVYYPIPLHQQSVFKKDFSTLSLPVAEKIAKRCLSLPIFPEITEQQITIVSDALIKALT